MPSASRAVAIGFHTGAVSMRRIAPRKRIAVQIAQKTPRAAAIASPIAAEFYGVPVLEENIQDKPDNTKIAKLTRHYFLAIALQGAMQVVTILIMARLATGV